MVQSSRARRRSNGGSNRGNGSRKRPAQSKQSGGGAAKKRKSEAEDEAGGGADEELFQVEKIVGSKLGKYGVLLYRTRWKGYSASDDTWEPAENVASTGHLDRYERQQRQRKLKLKKGTPGVAVIEYEDGERETVDLTVEKFRGYIDDSDDDSRDDDTVDGDDDVNNFALVIEGEWIEILWKHASMYFACKIISWTPRKEDPSRKRAFEVWGKSLESSTKPSKQPQRGEDVSNGNKRNNTPAPDAPMDEIVWKNQGQQTESMGKPEEAPMECQNDFGDKSINSQSSGLSDDASYADRQAPPRVGHGVPLFDEPEDDFDSSDDESDSELEEDGAYQNPDTEGPKMSFEELWAQKIRRTQELMDKSDGLHK